ncbi:MAG TPA: hypothetical protein PK825_06880 [Bacteroidales bacterium]|nr:hypothetical protein [Bacteroidales bacterium]
MDNRLQELTEKIYREGLEKGNQEAEKIVSAAKAQAEEIIKRARVEENRILEEAKKASAEMRENTMVELKLSMRQAMNNLRQEITDLISKKVTSQAIKGIADDPAFIRDILLAVASNWSPDKSGRTDLVVLLPASKEKELREYFLSKATDLLKKGLELKFDENLTSGFEITPADGSYRISFTDEVFENFLRDYLKPRLMEYLFEK